MSEQLRINVDHVLKGLEPHMEEYLDGIETRFEADGTKAKIVRVTPLVTIHENGTYEDWAGNSISLDEARSKLHP